MNNGLVWHSLPLEEEHDIAPDCWCHPTLQPDGKWLHYRAPERPLDHAVKYRHVSLMPRDDAVDEAARKK